MTRCKYNLIVLYAKNMKGMNIIPFENLLNYTKLYYLAIVSNCTFPPMFNEIYRC